MILVVAEQRDGKLNRATLETVAAAQQLAGGDADQGGRARAVRRRRRSGAWRHAVSEVLLVEHADACDLHARRVHAAAVQQVVASAKPTYVLLPHTYQTRDFAPMLAARIGRRAHHRRHRHQRHGRRRHVHAADVPGQAGRRSAPPGDGPLFVTIQIGAFRADAA